MNSIKTIELYVPNFFWFSVVMCEEEKKNKKN